MDSLKFAAGVGGLLGRYKRAAVGLTMALTVVLLVCDIMIRLSPRAQPHGDAVSEPLRYRSRRSTNSTPSVRNATPIPAGAVYTHWGRSDCSSSAQILYKGIVGSEKSGNTGGGADYLCLANEPEWLSSSSAGQSYVYGVEYQTNVVGMTVGQNAVCAVCQSTRTNKLMIPGRTSCIDGWTREYNGYLMSAAHNDKASRGFICVDKTPQADWASNGAGSGGAGKLFHARGVCGALPCPKYKNVILTCVLCTR